MNGWDIFHNTEYNADKVILYYRIPFQVVIRNYLSLLNVFPDNRKIQHKEMLNQIT